jgi:hypothetical protein
MSFLQNYHPDARAVLLMTAGMATPGLPALLEQYGYAPDDTKRGFWKLEEAGTEGSGLFFIDDWTEVAIVGDSRENIENVNYILSRGGWTGLEIKAGDQQIEEDLLATISTLDITEVTSLWKTDEFDFHAPEASQKARSPAVDTAISTAVSLSESADELKMALKAVEAKDLIIQQQADKISALEARVKSLESQQPGASIAAQGEPGKLVGFVERYLLQQFNSTLKDMDVVNELQAAGYGIKISVVPR